MNWYHRHLEANVHFLDNWQAVGEYGAHGAVVREAPALFPPGYGIKRPEEIEADVVRVQQMFPDVDEGFLRQLCSQHSFVMAVNFIIDSDEADIPRRILQPKVPTEDRDSEDSADEESSIAEVANADEEISPMTRYARYARVFASNKASADNVNKFRYHMGKPPAHAAYFEVDLLCGIFVKCSRYVVRRALVAFNNHIAPAYAVLFAIENGLPVKNAGGWDILEAYRELNRVERRRVDYRSDRRMTADMRREMNLIESLGRTPLSSEMNGQKFECPVCLEDQPFFSSLECAPVDQGEYVKRHRFCKECVEGHARELATGGAVLLSHTGLPCMDPQCNSIIPWKAVRKILPKNIKRRLSDRLQEANLQAAGFTNIERCKACNYALLIDEPKTVNKVFECKQCGAKHCRLCEQKWDDAHIGRKCEEVNDAVLHQYQQKLTEAITRKCPRCTVLFQKIEGCNKMTCRCGMTQCYLCRESGIGYEHFCRHLREPGNPRCTDPTCTKKCLLFSDAITVMNEEISRIKEQARRDPRLG